MRTAVVCLILMLVIPAGCARRAPDGATADDLASSMPPGAWDRLATMKIYFGHQSVGQNIIEGVQDLVASNPAGRLRVLQSRRASDFEHPVFAHARNGANTKPLSKIADFSAFLNTEAGDRLEVAFFKFCYIDFDDATDVPALFTTYRSAMAELRQKHPATRLVHVTVPLTVVQGGWKASVKRMLGKSLSGAGANIKRNEFNELMRKEYSGREPVFDLATVESTYPDGGRRTFSEGGRVYYALVEDYTADGEHLNSTGRRRAAAQLLALLAALRKD